MKSIRESVLLKTSSNADIQCSGGKINITGLKEILKRNVTGINQIKYRAAVAQVVTIGNTSYTPTGLTNYTVEVYDPNRVSLGFQEAPKRYTFQTNSNVLVNGATPALQREAIHLGLIAKINADASNHATAASLGTGTGFTVTDNTDYYPERAQTMTNEKFVNVVIPVTNSDSSGFTRTNFTITTAGLTSSGVGAKLAQQQPQVDFVFGNLTSGVQDAPFGTATNPKAYANSGQNYDIFTINSLKEIVGANLSGQYVYVPRESYIAIDNGTGSSVTNLAGFLTAERELRKLMVQTFTNDDTTVQQWFDQGFLEQAPLGAVPSGTAAASNTFLTPYGSLVHYQINTQTILTAAQGANGLLIEQDLTATDGAAYYPNLATPNSQQFIVGKTAMTVNAKASFTTPANIVFMVGFRAKEAASQGFASNTKNAFIGTGAAGTFFATYGALVTASTVTTTSGVSALTTVAYDFRVEIAIDGTVTAYANNVSFPIYSSGTTPLVFAAGTVLIPHLQYTNLNGTTAVANVSEFWSVGSDLVID
jgi:hypothetical protein